MILSTGNPVVCVCGFVFLTARCCSLLHLTGTVWSRICFFALAHRLSAGNKNESLESHLRMPLFVKKKSFFLSQASSWHKGWHQLSTLLLLVQDEMPEQLKDEIFAHTFLFSRWGLLLLTLLERAKHVYSPVQISSFLVWLLCVIVPTQIALVTKPLFSALVILLYFLFK